MGKNSWSEPNENYGPTEALAICKRRGLAFSPMPNHDVTLHCRRCHRKFSVPPWRRHKAIYCSGSCRSKANYHGPVRKPQPRVSLHCRYCDREFSVPPWRHQAIYCSMVCFNRIRCKPELPPEIIGVKKSSLLYKQIKANGRSMNLHRHLMEEHLGRRLETWEQVHHINGDRYDNRLENLTVLSRSDHMRLHGRLSAQQHRERVKKNRSTVLAPVRIS